MQPAHLPRSWGGTITPGGPLPTTPLPPLPPPCALCPGDVFGALVPASLGAASALPVTCAPERLTPAGGAPAGCTLLFVVLWARNGAVRFAQ